MIHLLRLHGHFCMHTSVHFGQPLGGHFCERFGTHTAVMHLAGTIVNFQCLEGSVVLAKIVGSSQHGANYQCITSEHFGTVVTHNCAKRRAKSPAKHAAKPTTRQPIVVARVEHVPLFKVMYLHQKKCPSVRRP